jgi:hypothetical protein
VAPEITAVEESTTPVDEVELDKEIEHLLV